MTHSPGPLPPAQRRARGGGAPRHPAVAARRVHHQAIRATGRRAGVALCRARGRGGLGGALAGGRAWATRGSVTAIDRDTSLLADLAASAQRHGGRGRPHDDGRSDRRASTSSTRARCSCTSTTPTRVVGAPRGRPAPRGGGPLRGDRRRPAEAARAGPGPARRRSATCSCRWRRSGPGRAAWRRGSESLGFVDVHDDVREDLLTGATPGCGVLAPDPRDHPAHRHRRRARMGSLGRVAVDDSSLRRHDRAAGRTPTSRCPSPPGTACRAAGRA